MGGLYFNVIIPQQTLAPQWLWSTATVVNPTATVVNYTRQLQSMTRKGKIHLVVENDRVTACGVNSKCKYWSWDDLGFVAQNWRQWPESLKSKYCKNCIRVIRAHLGVL